MEYNKNNSYIDVCFLFECILNISFYLTKYYIKLLKTINYLLCTPYIWSVFFFFWKFHVEVAINRFIKFTSNSFRCINLLNISKIKYFIFWFKNILHFINNWYFKFSALIIIFQISYQSIANVDYNKNNTYTIASCVNVL